ncbi:hypothetical protein [Actinomadura sp. RB99]|uniref:hypothetical protein n=1 Tax=Actinomadura sp. RB99 TaxID=2691577 RepID=UPI001682A5AA|nr:hypothetical protein [Actinomadura sp. RB99]
MSAPDKTRRRIQVSVPDEPPRLTPEVARVLLRIVLAARSAPVSGSQHRQEEDR